MILIERNFIRLEEQRLEQKFGPHWLEYRRRVRRWM
jgi:protein-S-isoprenylcysteine O-methyltransferase Ste14